MKFIVKLLTCVVLLFGLVAIFTPVVMKKWISSNYQHVSIDERYNTYIKKSSESLQRVRRADFGLSISEDSLSEIFDATIAQGIDQIGRIPIEDIGTIEVLGHSLVLTATPMSLVISGNLEFTVPEREFFAVAALNIRVFGRFSNGEVAYVPTLVDIELLELRYDRLSWWPFGLAGIANSALDISMEAINGAIAEQRYSVMELQSLTKEVVSFQVLDREVAIRQPTLGASALLVDNGGVMVIGEILLEGENLAPPPDTPNEGKYLEYREDFLSKADSSDSGLQLGQDQFWLHPSSVAKLSLLDPVDPISAKEFTARTLGITAARLQRISKPTLALTIDHDDVEHALSSAFSEIGEALTSRDKSLRFAALPEIKLGEGIIHLSAQVEFSNDKLSIGAALSALIGISLSGNEARLSAVLSQISFENVELNNADGVRWPVDIIANMAQTLAESLVPAFNGILQNHPIPLPLEPLVVAGQIVEAMEFDVAGRSVVLPPPMLEEWVALIHPKGVSLVARISPYRVDAELPEEPPGVNATYPELLKLFQLRAREVHLDFDMNETGFRLSEGLLLGLLKPVSDPLAIEQVQLKAISQSHKLLSTVAGPDLAVSIPAQLLREIATDQTRLNAATLKRVGLEIDAEKIVISFGQQALSIETEFQYKRDGLSVSGSVKGSVFVGYSGGDLSLRPMLTHITLDSINFEELEFLDVNGITGSVVTMANQLLPILNGAVDALKIEIPQLSPFHLNLQAATDDVDGLTISPETFTIQAPEAMTPVLLITDEHILAIADLSAEYLKGRTQSLLKIPHTNNSSVAYAAYRADFEKTWQRKFAISNSQASLHAELATDRMAETLEILWVRAGLKASYRKRESSNSARTPVAAISPRASCGDPCGRPSCDRNKACKPRKECRNVSEIVTVPVTVVKEICNPVTSTIQVVEQQCKQTFKDIPFVGKILGDVVCSPINVSKNVTKNVCKSVTVVEKIQKNITKQVCEEVADAACLVTLEKCTLKWKTYDFCALPFKTCTEVLRGVQKTLATIDFDKIGYASTEASVDLSANLDASSALKISDDLRRLSIAPHISGHATVSAKLKFEARASAFLGCIPMRPLEIKNYRGTVPSQAPQITAIITPSGVSKEGGLKLAIDLAAIRVSGKVPSPLTKLLADNPDTLVTCPFLGVPLAGLASVTDTKITKEALGKAIRSVTKKDIVSRLLLDGEVDYNFELPTIQVEVPAFPLNIGSKKFEFQPSFGARSIEFSSK